MIDKLQEYLNEAFKLSFLFIGYILLAVFLFLFGMGLGWLFDVLINGFYN